MISGDVRRTLMWRNWLAIGYVAVFVVSAVLDAKLPLHGRSLPAALSPVLLAFVAIPVALALLFIPYRSEGIWRGVRPRPAAAIGLLAVVALFFGAALFLGAAMASR